MATIRFRTEQDGRTIGAGSFDYPDSAGPVVKEDQVTRFEYVQDGWPAQGAKIADLTHLRYIRGANAGEGKLALRVQVGDRRMDLVIGESDAIHEVVAATETRQFVADHQVEGSIQALITEAPSDPPVGGRGPFLPTLADDENDTSPVKNVVFTADIFTAAMTRLNSESVLNFLGEMMDVISERTAGSESTIGTRIELLRQEIFLRIVGVETHQTATAGELIDLDSRVDQLYNTSVVTTSKVDGLTEVTNVLRQDVMVLKQHMEGGELDIAQALQQITDLNEKMRIVKELSESLDQGELGQVRTLLLELLQNTNVQEILGKTRIVIDDRYFPLDRLLQVLVQADRVRNVQFQYSAHDISGATLMLIDGTAVTFHCHRQDTEARDVVYEFLTPDWKGLRATFNMSFKRRERAFTLCGKSLSQASYDASTTSNIVFNLSHKFTLEAA